MCAAPVSKIYIPSNEIQENFVRSSGAGGQNINKTSTKVVVHWPIGKSHALSSEQKDRVRIKLANRINSSDELVLSSEGQRSQLQNRLRAIANLETLVAKAVVVPKSRRATKPTYSSKLRRLESKKIRSKIKLTRRSVE